MLASRAVHRECTQYCHALHTWLLVASKHRGLQDRQRPFRWSGVCSAHFWGPRIKIPGGRVEQESARWHYH